jgi:hypothetical protein
VIDFKRSPEEIIGSFFNSMKDYIQDLIDTKRNIMNGLYKFNQKSWEIPKKYKGNSSQMGFIAEYLIFETLKLWMQRKKGISFSTKVRTRTGNNLEETNYFVDDSKNAPVHLLCQGLRVRRNDLKLPYLKYAHDITYLIKKRNWLVKAIFEVKSFFDSPSLKGDIEKLEYGEKYYLLERDYVLVFVGFKNTISNTEKEYISKFTRVKNHYCILPVDKNPKIGNSLLEEVLELM